MTPHQFLSLIIRPTLAWMGSKYMGHQSEVMLLAIALQESELQHRVQVRGPARGFWQFELGGGVRGVLTHRASQQTAIAVCHALRYESTADAVYEVLPDNDILACAFARLLLYTHPKPLPALRDADAAWHQYEADLWRPGRPHPDKWHGNYETALEAVTHGDG